MQITSTAFEHQGYIPKQYTCEDANISPPLKFSDAPADTQSLALICDDPDAATDPDGPGDIFDHWLLANLPSHTTQLEEAFRSDSVIVGSSSSGLGYTGPCPPNGVHRYYFRLYALDIELQLAEGFSKSELMEAMAGHVIDEAELLGLYEKQDS